ncbi:hypothetical protein QQ045_027484 [Rhodiola kirilowii]
MSDIRDPHIKLFGADIHLPETPPSSDDTDHLHPPPSAQATATDRCQVTRVECHLDDPSSHDEESKGLGPSPGDSVNISRNLEEDQFVETDTGSQEKVLKKPDKVIPCPRCRSLNTKFCYFNNYNVNQPRHFCKNCQRYWTAGGTIRNVPVGAGKRKNKQLPLQYNQVATSSEGSTQGDSVASSDHLVQSNLSISIPPTSLNGNDEAAKLCMTPLCDSMVSMFSQNGPITVELASTGVAEEPSLSVSSILSTTMNELELQNKEAAIFRPSGLYHGSTPSIPLPYCTNPQWTYPWVPVTCWRQPGEPTETGHISLEDVPVICTPDINFPVIPYWGCIPVFNNSASKVSLAGSSQHFSSPCATDSPCSSSSTANLGKHLRETNASAEEKKCLWVPKSKKIDSMDTAAKCSILNSLGLKPGKNEPITKGNVFKAFKHKPGSSKHTIDETVPSMKSNPAALSRSQSFQEST